MDYLIRPLTTADQAVLWEMLYQALQPAEGEPAPPRDIVRRPEFARYVEDWGRPGDVGFVAFDSKRKDELLGAAWIRLPADKTDATPELALAVKTGLRRRGIGAALLTQLVKTTLEHSTISIRAAPNNPVVRLYERFGFKIVQQTVDSVTMQRQA